MSLKPMLDADLRNRQGRGLRIGKRVVSFTYTENGQHIPWCIKIAKLSDIGSTFSEQIVYLTHQEMPDGKLLTVIGDEAEEVRVEVERLLKNRFDLQWSPVIAIRIDQDGRSSATWDDWRGYQAERKLEFSFNLYEVATRHDGTSVYRGWIPPVAGRLARAAEQVHDGMPSGTVIPFTPDAFDKLTHISDAINTLRERLSDLLSPALVQATLANVRAIGLPAPDEGKPKHGRRGSIRA